MNPFSALLTGMVLFFVRNGAALNGETAILPAMGEIGLALGVALLLSGMFLIAGRWILVFLRVPFAGSEGFFLSFALGSGLVSIVLFFLGIFQFYSIFVFRFFFFSGAGVLIFFGFLKRTAWQKRLRGWLTQKGSLIEWLCLSFLFLVLAEYLIGSLTPVHDADVLNYHFALPKLYLNSGGIQEIPWKVSSHYPLGIPMLYLFCFGIGIQGTASALVLNYVFSVFLLVGVIAFGKRFLERPAGLIAAVLLSAMPFVMFEAGLGKVGIPLALYELAALYCFFRFREDKKWTWVLLAGVFMGFALNTKFFSLFSFFPLFFLFLFSAPRQVCWFLGIAVVVGSPWYLRNWVEVGNPVWPFFLNFFDGQNLTGSQLEIFSRSFSETIFPKLAEAASRMGGLLGTNTRHSMAFPQATFGSLLLLVFPLFWFRRIRRHPEMTLILYLLGFLAFWTLVTGNFRYIIPILSVVSLLIAQLAVKTWRFSTLWRYAAFLPLVSLTPFLITNRVGALRVALGMEAHERYLSRKIDSYPVVSYINRNLPKYAKILLLRETRGFYLERKYVSGDPTEAAIDYEKMNSTETLERTLRNLGITHILWNPKLGKGEIAENYWAKKVTPLYEKFLQERGRPIYSHNDVHLFMLTP